MRSGALFSFTTILALAIFSATAQAADPGELYRCEGGNLSITDRDYGLIAKLSGDLVTQLVEKNLHPAKPTTDNTHPILGFAFFQAVKYESGDMGWTVFSDYTPTSHYRKHYFYYFKPQPDKRSASLEIWEIADGAHNLDDGIDVQRDRLQKTVAIKDCD